jgi:hypothetical protein
LIWRAVRAAKGCGDWASKLLFDRELPPATQRQQELSAALLRELADAPQATILPMWAKFRDEVRRNLSHYDPRSFLRWRMIQHTMCVTNSPSIISELWALRFSGRWEAFRQAVVESPVGCPVRFLFYPASSGNLLRHCYHLLRFEQATGVDITRMKTIVEFGGGYGSMCRVFYRRGFSGRYFIYDLPEFSALQRYFLKSLDLPVRDATDDCTADGIYLFRELPLLQRALEQRPEPDDSAFVATWSLSECPVELRDRFLPLVESMSCFLIAFQDRFFEVDNNQYFAALREATGSRIQWQEMRIPQLPRNNYLFGTRWAPERVEALSHA